ncbi:bifunctional indole-3-glycerol-phosphate synthase TrpC/phosphoribosylanthranilate isomerase TrpF [Buchnera aphidicola]|uniref:bifunctional indole-3-glycerol-phosphate synthase TrpC/phosphoribosylanthranilate isomerase TrpF n=1 Tax=Buchnera aphidicola TaxID=9 RepID=UPI0031B8B24F
MNNNILKEILYNKVQYLKYYKKIKPCKTIKKKIFLSHRNFYSMLKLNNPAFILEAKKASPSKGIINKNFNIEKIAKVYSKHATIISVLTDEKYFQGKLSSLTEMSQLTKQPILCKDFFIDPYQIYLSRYHQADAVLLMLSYLNDIQYHILSNIAHSLNMGVLTEISNYTELKRAITLNAKVIGINNRNFNNFHVSLNKTKILAPLIPQNRIIISESGIQNNKQVNKLKKIVHGFLIGTEIMQAKNIALKVNSIIFGNNKICGLTRSRDAKRIKDLGATHGGLIFVKNSLRNITIHQANKIISSVKLKYVGVFQDEEIKKIQLICHKLNLYAIQLHGNENQQYIQEIKRKLPKKIKIIKALCINNYIKKINFKYIDYFLFDNIRGGSGNCFNWNFIQLSNLDKIFLSGGLSEKNCQKAKKLNYFGLDFNSKIETSPGIKNYKKLKILFQKLKS